MADTDKERRKNDKGIMVINEMRLMQICRAGQRQSPLPPPTPPTLHTCLVLYDLPPDPHYNYTMLIAYHMNPLSSSICNRQ
jgi:hypothetical protein